ncbi:MAG TPA: hypothetical protein VMN39_03455, partial [Longimicrobiaceae bacterium]|nr:hypothetical protein [Longimicrobiaceae bacterium]
MLGADGRRYVLRSVQKTTRQALAEEFWGTPVESIMRDQLCSFHPSGAVIVARLLAAVGVLHAEPSLMVVPDDPRLEEFREEFAGMLVLFEERPDEEQDGSAGFAGSDRVVQIENLFDDLEEYPEDRVETSELLRSRLIDILVGDRDRSINNHLWASFDQPGGGKLWRPVPRDRDQSFVRFDGAAKSVFRYYDKRLVSFGDEYPDIEGLTRNAWDIDRTLLVGLEREVWDGIVREVMADLTDEVIADAVRTMPPEHHALVGADIERSLRLRRDRLAAAADEFYEIVFRYADIRATDEDEVAVIEGMPGGRVRVAIYRSDNPHFERTFLPRETRELRIYLHGGDDLVRIEGDTDPGILVRVITGGGRDALVNSVGRRRVVLYDAGDGTEVSGENTSVVRRDVPRLYSWWIDGEGDLDWGSRSTPLPAISYDGDRGLVLGLGIRRDGYAFLKQPFGSSVQASVGWAVGRGEPIIDYRHHLQSWLGSADLMLRARYSGVEIVRFHGLGNETQELEDPDFYEVHQKQLAVGFDVGLGDGERRLLSIGPILRHTSSDTSRAETLIAGARPYGTGSFTQAGIRLAFDVDGRDVSAAPRHGYRIEGGASFYPEMLDVVSSFGEVHGEAAYYLSPPAGNPTLALRVGGRKVAGTFPYSDAAFLGGAENIRGLREQRFAGNAAVYGNAELRVFLTRIFVL